jgi:transposase-like protein
MERMMKQTRRKFDAGVKAKIALEAVWEDATMAELAARHGIHPNQIYNWKKQLIDNAAQLFAGSSSGAAEGRRGGGVDGTLRQDRPADGGTGFFIQEVRTMSKPDREAMLVRGNTALSVRRQCALVRLARSGVYRPKAAANPDQAPWWRNHAC